MKDSGYCHQKSRLGDHPAALAALRKAVEDEPTSKIARYLLGRTYRRQGDLTNAKAVLKPAVEDPSDHRTSVAYALIEYALGSPGVECIAILRLCEETGRRDPRYIATRGGLHFLNGEFTQAQELFDEAARGRFSYSELQKINFKPHDAIESSNPLAFQGEIGALRAGFAFVRVVGYPDVFCPGSKFGSLQVREGMKVKFRLGFSARGPVALDLEEMS